MVWISGANVAECAPITTDYVWQARERGAKVIVVDPRLTPIARTCDLYLPIRPGTDVALFDGVLHLMIEQGWVDHDFVGRWTTGFEDVARHVAEWTPERTARVTGPVVPQVERGRFHCPCHEGTFDLATGRPLAGPPRRPLPRVRLELRGDRVFAVGVEERTA